MGLSTDMPCQELVELVTAYLDGARRSCRRITSSPSLSAVKPTMSATSTVTVFFSALVDTPLLMIRSTTSCGAKRANES